MHEAIDAYYPRTYLDCWAQHVRTDWAEFLDRVFLSDVPTLLGQEGGTVIDLGCGPSICSIISASRWSREIYLTELLEGNRKEVEKWVKDQEGAYNWQHYMDFQGVLELNPDTASIASRVRAAVAGVLPCDLATDSVFPQDAPRPPAAADILIASLVFDVVCVDAAQLQVMMARALNWVKEDGLMIVQGSFGETAYAVGSAYMPVLDIQEDQFLKVVEALGLEVVRLETTVRVSTHYYTVLRRQKTK